MSEWDTDFVRRHMSVDGIGAPSEANRNRFDYWLAEHDREVAAKAWEEGAIAAWNRSGKQVFGESYEELDFIPLSLRETNPYEQKGAGK